ncbi:MAG: translation initiation factor IF-2 [Candidatus Micrarchaeota archaeon]|nr:translation initiation factor IF-2 [Candidatus Micrarchaeota archaeon]
MVLRSPIISVLGHVDHGKTSLLDAIRKSSVVKKEAGKITQMIGSSYVPKEEIEAIGKDILKKFKFEIKIPGILFIDTPGHEAFTSLRERGGSIADLAILVIDITQGVQPQTIESLNILKSYKTPFVVALTKIDLIHGWKETGKTSFLEAFAQQPEHVKQEFQRLVWDRMAELGEQGFNADLFHNIQDFKTTVAMIPVSSKTKEGIAELLVFIAALSQKFLTKSLEISEDEKPKGTILDIKQLKTGNYIDIILYEGILRKGDILYTITRDNKLKQIKVKGLFLPNVASNNPKEKYKAVKEVAASIGVRLFVSDVDDVLTGAPISADPNLDVSLVSDIFKADEEGIVVKVDSLGSADAIKRLLKKHGIPIAKIDLGPISKEDIELAHVMAEKKPEYGVVLGFNVNLQDKTLIEFANTKGVKILQSEVIYSLIDLYKEYVHELKKNLTEHLKKQSVPPAKIKILPGYIFRISKPAIVGIRVEKGILRSNVPLMNEQGEIIGEVKGIQKNKEQVEEAREGEEVAISIQGATARKDFQEGDYLYTEVSKKDLELWQDEVPQDLIQELNKILLLRRLRR